jgi:hypothetical protein
MGFYYGPGTPPDDGKDEGTLKEAFLITWTVFKILALPVGILLGGVMYLVLIFVMFDLHPAAGLGTLVLPFAAVVARAIWERKHPPVLP